MCIIHIHISIFFDYLLKIVSDVSEYDFCNAETYEIKRYIIWYRFKKSICMQHTL